MHFFYDAQGKPAMVRFNNVDYFYVYNLQGDVVAIVDTNGSSVVAYCYDAWGNPTSMMGSMTATLGRLNPFRYRGYVYDEETGLYYLRSRYYNPVWKRFINADLLLGNIASPLSHNAYAYCRNYPTLGVDQSGEKLTLQSLTTFVQGLSQKINRAIRKIVLKKKIYDSIVARKTDKEGQWVKIPNNTPEVAEYISLLYEEQKSKAQEYYTQLSYYLCGNDYMNNPSTLSRFARDAAHLAEQKYANEFGEEFNIPTSKTIVEIKLHYLAYKFNFRDSSSKETDVCEHEGGNFQTLIDLMYAIGLR